MNMQHRSWKNCTPITSIENLETLLLQSLSQSIAWVSWAKVIAPLNQGGLNIGSLSISNQGLLAKWWWRFATENTSLWCNIIRSIHGPQGGLHDAHSIRSKSGPWYQIAKLNVDLGVHGIDLHSLLKIKVGNGESTRFWIDKWVGNSPLCSSFPRLFRLDSNPLCRVCERSPSIVSSLLTVPDILSTDQIYNPLGISIGPAMAEIVGLFDPPWTSFPMVTNDQDKWVCLIDQSRCFMVKGIRTLIINSYNNLSSTPTKWNKLVPIKVNILCWRIDNRRLPTRVNLDKRGIDLDSVRCPVCDNDLETEEHILVKCNVANSVWIEVLKWWKIHNVQINSINDILSLANRASFSPNITNVFEAVILSTMWIIWRFRNDSTFAFKKPKKSLIINDIKLFTFNWISNRFRKATFNWFEWLFNPCNALSISL
ncbi:RNA-directed DNA polymerase, eukaryota, reverse transcriptase zinc-binding domain protein [Tanacetum coccineum]